MDTNNVRWILSDGKEGYPAGSFYNRVFLVLTGKNDLGPVDTLFDLFNRADTKRTVQLNAPAPSLLAAVHDLYNGRMSQEEFRESYSDVLEDIPAFVGRAFPECVTLVERARAELEAV